MRGLRTLPVALPMHGRRKAAPRGSEIEAQLAEKPQTYCGTKAGEVEGHGYCGLETEKVDRKQCEESAS